MTFTQFIINYWQYIVSGLVSACFLVVNIIQAIRTHDKSKLKDAICRIPEIIRSVEVLYGKRDESTPPLPLPEGIVAADLWSLSKKAAAESLIKAEFGEKFFKKYISVFDDAIEDILNTPQKKGGSYGISKENEER